LSFPAFLKGWRQQHPRGYRRWRHLLIRTIDLLIVRVLVSSSNAYDGKLCTCMLEEIALARTCDYLNSPAHGPGHERMLRDRMNDHNSATACQRTRHENSHLFLGSDWPIRNTFWPSPTPAPLEVRFPLDFLVAYRDERMRLADVPLLMHVPRRHMAACRIHRFWRDVCSSPLYAHATQTLSPSDHHIAIG